MLLPIIIISGLAFASIGLLSWALYPVAAERAARYGAKRIEADARRLDSMFLTIPSKRKLIAVHLLSVVGLGLVAAILTRSLLFGVVGALIGLPIPTLVIKSMDAKRKRKFQGQLVDGLMILSSSLKGGLSLLQAIETLVEEMPPPISEEFGLVIRENKMGVPLEESLDRLNKRMGSHELNLITTAILVTREIGGDLTEVFRQLVGTLRETTKLLGKVKTLTLQGKIQGCIMSLLPVAFVAIVWLTNRDYLRPLFESKMGQMLLAGAVVLEIVGTFLIWKVSRIDV